MSASLAKRQRVIDFALQQAYEGAHYLWGSLGTTPNYGAEVTFYPKSLNPKTVSFCAAQCSRNSGLQICGGRFAQKALAAVWKGPPGSSKGVAVSASDPALAKWISDNGHYAMTDWDDTLTPRVTKGVGVTEQIVWGEGCDGTRHFDCISFINWCLKKVSPKWQTADIPHFFYSIEPRGAAVQTREVTDDDDVMPADILLYGKVVKPAADYFRERVADEREQGKDDAADADQAAYNKGETSAAFRKDYHIPVVPKYGVGVGLHHIGFATGKGNQRVHASDNANGVIIDTWHEPVRRVRLPDTWFV